MLVGHWNSGEGELWCYWRKEACWNDYGGRQWLVYIGGKLAAGVKIYPLRSRNEGKTNVVKNYRIVERKSLEDMGESTEGEVAARWVGWSVGGTSRSHMVASRRDFSHGGF